MASDPDADATASANGELAARSNGVSISGHQPTLQFGITNGTHKLVSSVNGSSHGNKFQAGSRHRPEYCGHDPEEVTRLIMQALSDLGYHNTASSLGSESGLELENPTVSAFKTAVLSGSWAEAEQLLMGASHGSHRGNGIVLDEGVNRNEMRCRLRQQKFLELLEQQNTARALVVLREELAPMANNDTKIAFLSSLLMCESLQDLKEQTEWDGANGESRRILLSYLSQFISPSVMLPEKRLGILLSQTKTAQITNCTYHTASSSPSLYYDHSCRPENFPTELALELGEVMSEVWKVEFSPDGSMLAACGSSKEVVIWDSGFQRHRTFRGHEGMGGQNRGVGNLAWNPTSTMLVTCSQDGFARLWDVSASTQTTITTQISLANVLQAEAVLKQSRKFAEPVIGCVWTKDGRSFVVGSLDRDHSLVTYNLDDNVVVDWNKKHRVQDLCGSEDGRWLVAVDDANTIHVYNAANRELEYELELPVRPTSISISKDSKHLLVNKRDGEAQLIDLGTKQSTQKFLGHTGGDFLIRSSFGGANESFVASGSEDGNILIWHKTIGRVVERLHGHHPRCNAVSWNPNDPSMLATCGDDGSVKIWTNKERSKMMRQENQYSI